MKLNKLVLALPALFSASFAAYGSDAPVPPKPFPSEVATPDINNILSTATDGWPTAKGKWDAKYQSIITGNQYINGETFTRAWFLNSFSMLKIIPIV